VADEAETGRTFEVIEHEEEEDPMSRFSFASLTALVLALSVAACAPAAPPDTTGADLAALDAFRDAWVAAYNSGDADAVANLYADDAVNLPQGQPTVIGRGFIRDGIAAQLATGATTVTVTADATQVSGNLAFDSGTYSTVVRPATGGGPVTVTGRYIVILRRQTDGSWKMVRGIDNSPTPPTPTGGL
jgi:uncharacterized protein (TIGR02246 family)